MNICSYQLNKISGSPSTTAEDILWWNTICHAAWQNINSWLAFMYSCHSAGCSGSHCLFWLRGMKDKKWEDFLELCIHSLTQPFSQLRCKKVYYVLEKNGILFFSISVATLIKSLPKSHWSKLTSVKGSWPCGHLRHEILKIKSTERNKGSLHTVDNSACKVPVCRLTNYFYVQQFESFGLEWKWNGFQESFPDHFGLFPKMWVVVKLLSFVSEQTVSAGFGDLWTVQSMEHFRFALGKGNITGKKYP